jgi:ferredoxin-NADP reductase
MASAPGLLDDLAIRFAEVPMKTVATFKVRLKSRQEIAEETMAFRFEKPPGFLFKAGQFVTFTLIHLAETDAQSNRRIFSLASAPYELDLMIATRLRDSAFKRVLRSIKVGTELAMSSPSGSLTLHADQEIPAVFLTGGIGITPVRSLILQATRDKLPHRLTLFDENRKTEDMAFLSELKKAEIENPNFTIVESASKVAGESGHITAVMLKNCIVDLSLPIFYLSGPAATVEALRKTLKESDVDDQKIRTEIFSGY